MTETWYPRATRLSITTSEAWVPRQSLLESIVDHITDGNDSRDYLQHADNGSSVHFLIREENGVGVVYQFMPVEWAAWGNGRWSENNPYMPQWIKTLLPKLRTGEDNINHHTVSIEHERKWPFTTPLPPALKEASIDLHRWLCNAFPTITIDRNHIIGHYQIDNVSRANCPGGPGGKLFPFDEIISRVQGAPAHVVMNGYTVTGRIYDEWRKGGIETNGVPISEVETMNFPGVGQLQVQWFERARIELNPTTGQVTRGRIGAELYEVRHGH